MKKYLPLKDNGQRENYLKVELYYSKGGMNYFTYRNEPRGYYISATPVERNGIMEGFTAFTGIRKLVREVSRKSEKAEREAEATFETEAKELIEYVLNKQNLELAEA